MPECRSSETTRHAAGRPLHPHIGEELLHVVVGDPPCETEGRYAVRIREERIGAVATQDTNHIAATARCEHGAPESSVAMGVRDVDRSACREECFAYGRGIRLGGEVKGCPAIVVSRARVRPRGKQRGGARRIAIAGGVVELGSPVFVHAGPRLPFGLLANHELDLEG
jgi:hypothetical protein